MMNMGRGILDVINKTSKLKKFPIDDSEMMMEEEDEESESVDPYEIESERAPNEPDDHYKERISVLKQYQKQSPNAIPNAYYDEFYDPSEEGLLKIDAGKRKKKSSAEPAEI